MENMKSNEEEAFRKSLKPIYYFSWPTAQSPIPTHTIKRLRYVKNQEGEGTLSLQNNRHMLNPLSFHKFRKKKKLENKNIEMRDGRQVFYIM